ncbi:MAG: EamA family transporter [Raineya sp.]|nr:EamA family transporter [Raineya sp.]MDW8297415.1 EamA family transporter [Raineya sp.]
MGYLYIFLTIILTVYGQLILKWRLNLKGAMPESWGAKLQYFWEIIWDFWVISSFASAFLASFTWIAALTKFDLSFAYPFTSIAFVLVLFLSYYFFAEPLSWQKIAGTLLIVAGIILLAQSK